MKKNLFILILSLCVVGLAFGASFNVDSDDLKEELITESASGLTVSSNCGDINVTISGCGSGTLIIAYTVKDGSGNTVASGTGTAPNACFSVNDLPDCEDLTITVVVRGCNTYTASFDTYSCNGGSVC